MPRSFVHSQEEKVHRLTDIIKEKKEFDRDLKEMGKIREVLIGNHVKELEDRMQCLVKLKKSFTGMKHQLQEYHQG